MVGGGEGGGRQGPQQGKEQEREGEGEEEAGIACIPLYVSVPHFLF
jgi:hypothetical protein